MTLLFLLTVGFTYFYTVVIFTQQDWQKICNGMVVLFLVFGPGRKRKST
jgi:hypothetical protein